jgi:predicted transcriptional regulator of viral defense system
MKISAADLLLQMVHDCEAAALTEFDIYLLAAALFRNRGYRDTPLPPKNGQLTPARARRLVSEITLSRELQRYIETSGRLVTHPDFLSRLYPLQADADAPALMMIADPFCYISHQSALARLGLALEAGNELHLSTPAYSEWSAKVRWLMQSRVEEAGLPDEQEIPFLINRPKFKSRVAGCEIHRHETIYPMDEQPVLITGLRVSPIGVTFRDSLTNPAWCGGMETVVQIWKEHAARHLDAIVSAISASREKIVKVRAGYLLDEVLGVRDARVSNWIEAAQRGSSRKLDPSRPFASRFSERWMLSINIE